MARARKNRKRTQQKGLSLTPIATPIIIVASMIVVVSGLNSRYQALGQEISDLESERKGLLQELRQVESRWARMMFPHRIEAALKRHRIHMIWPEDARIVRLTHDEVFGPGMTAPLRRTEVARLARER